MAEYTLTRTCYDTIGDGFNTVAAKLKAEKDVTIKKAQDTPVLSVITIETSANTMSRLQFDLLGWQIM